MKTPMYFLIFLFLLSCFSLQAQTEAVLQISHKEKTKTKYLKVGRNIQIHLADAKYKGRLDSVSPENIYIKGQAIPVKDIEKIRFKLRGTQIAGAIIGTGGLVITGAGIALLVQAVRDDSIGSLFLAIAGIAVTGVGIIPTSIGTTMFLLGKSYKAKDWEFTTAELAQ